MNENPIAKELQLKLQQFNNTLENISTKVVDLIPNHVSEDIYKQRLSTCEACSHYTEFRTCSLCGCWMINKCKLPNAHCPDNPPKW